MTHLDSGTAASRKALKLLFLQITPRNALRSRLRWSHNLFQKLYSISPAAMPVKTFKIVALFWRKTLECLFQNLYRRSFTKIKPCFSYSFWEQERGHDGSFSAKNRHLNTSKCFFVFFLPNQTMITAKTCNYAMCADDSPVRAEINALPNFQLTQRTIQLKTLHVEKLKKKKNGKGYRQ